MIVQAEQGHGGDWEFADSKIIDGMVLDISDEITEGNMPRRLPFIMVMAAAFTMPRIIWIFCRT